MKLDFKIRFFLKRQLFQFPIHRLQNFLLKFIIKALKQCRGTLINIFLILNYNSNV